MNDAALRHARWALGFVFFVNGAVFATWAVRIPAVAGGLELGPGALGFALLCQAAGTPLSMPLCGAAVTRFGSRPAIRVLLLAACVALPLPALAPNMWGLAVALALLGGSIGALVVAQNAQGVAIEKVGGRPILNSLHGLLSLGWLAGSLVGAGAARAGLPPVTHFAAVGAALLVAGLLATRYLLGAGTDRDAAGATFARPSKGLAILAVVSFCCLLAEGSVLDWSALYIKDSLGAVEGLAALGPAAFAATQTAGRFSGNRLVGRWSPMTLVRGATIVATLGILVAVLAGDPWVGVVGFGLLGAGLSVVFPLLLSTAGADRTGPPGPQVAAVATSGFLGLLAGPALVGGVAEVLDLRSALVVVVALVGLIPILASFSGLSEVPVGGGQDGKS